MDRRLRILVTVFAAASGGAALWWALSRRTPVPSTGASGSELDDGPVISQRSEPAGALTQVGAKPRKASAPAEPAPSPAPPADDSAIGRGQPWIRAYLSGLLREPPAGVTTSVRRERGCPVVKVSRGQTKVMECWAYDGYIRAAIHHPSDDTESRLRGFSQVDVRPPNRSGYVTAYVRGPEGVPALGWVITDSSRLDG